MSTMAPGHVTALSRKWNQVVMTLGRFLGVLISVLFLLTASARAEKVPAWVPGADAVEVPRELMPWLEWVRASVKTGLCPKVGEGERCSWPTSVEVDASEQGASFAFDVFLEQPGWVTLPGSATHWPSNVECDGKVAVVLAASATPTIFLSPGGHHVVGRFHWTKAPETLMIPANAGLLRLRVQGKWAAFPRREDSGALWLQLGDSAAMAATDRTEIEVFRRLTDDVPFRVTTLVVLRVSGKSRDLTLRGARLEQSQLLSVEAQVPARIEENGDLRLQIHAGEHRITLESLYGVPQERLSFPAHLPPWPAQELWAFVPSSAIRQVDLTGAPGVDPAQTNLPEDWKKHQVFLLSPKAFLNFETKRRGEPLPAPNQVSLARTLWLDFDGSGYTVKDHLTGTLSRSFRLDLEGFALGQAQVGGKDVLVTRGENGAQGVELRQSKLEMEATWRHEKSLLRLPAIGWKTDVTSLEATLNLPPGWELLHVSGADSVSDSWWADWTLWGFFYVLLITVAVSRLLGVRSAAIAFSALVLCHGRTDAPFAIWAVLIVLVALLKFVPQSWFREALRLTWLAVSLALAVVATGFIVGEVRGAFFPITHPPSGMAMPSFDGQAVPDPVPVMAPAVNGEDVAAKEEAVAEAKQALPQAPPPVEQQQAAQADAKVTKLRMKLPSRSQATAQGYDSSRGKLAIGSGSYDESVYVDPDSVVQTGPGLPTWSWQSVHLGWSGPVQQGQEVALYLLSPAWTKILACLRVLAVALLSVRLISRTNFRKMLSRVGPRFAGSAGAIALMVGFGTLLPKLAQAEPSAQVLEELKSRLTQEPNCESCVEGESLELKIAGHELAVRAVVHSGKLTSYRIPGPVRSWGPESVLVDGRKATALLLGEDGFLHVRLLPGRHSIEAKGPVFGNELVMTPGTAAHWVEVSAEGWAVDGIRDGKIEGSLHFTAEVKQAPEGATAAGDSSQRRRPPWLQITRHVELGVNWKILTEVTRKSPAGDPISLRYPLLPGEEVTESGAIVEQGQLLLTLGRDDTQATYRSVLPVAPKFELRAAKDKPWSERWHVRCGVLFHCSYSGVPPFAQQDDLGYAPAFQPLPGETLTVQVQKPPASPGASRTIERAVVEYSPGQRLLSGELGLTAKVSKSSPLSIGLSPKAIVQKLSINGRDEPIRMNGSRLELSLQPGRQEVQVTWHESTPLGFWFRAPSVTLAERVVNAQVRVRLPSDRWLLLLFGPSFGPKVLLWSYAILLLLAGFILVKIPKNPLRVWQWSLLGIGLTQVPLAVALIVGAWFFLMAIRGSLEVTERLGKRLMQLGLGLHTAVFLGCLCGAVYIGLVQNPDMLISAAPGSDGLWLNWYVDRLTGSLPTPVVLSLPVVVFRVLNLLWALWLASSLVGWLKWGFTQFAAGGLWVPKRQRTAPAMTTEPSFPTSPEPPPASSEP